MKIKTDEQISYPTGTEQVGVKSRLLMTSPAKVAFHQEKLQAFLAGRPIFPVTVEMDITTFCPKKCKDCPSTRSPEAQFFELDHIDRFFGRLEGQTKGLLISGGEPTSSPDFPAFLKLARARGFEEIAIVSNGAHLDEDETMAALMEDATIIRLSLYGWDEEVTRGHGTVLKKIETLRKHIDDSGSGLHIGVSALTASDRVPALGSLANAVADAGAHWIYFHPICTGWGTGHLRQTDQSGVTAEIARLQLKAGMQDFGVYFCPSRYENGALEFNEYYSAYFLMVVGADGVNYLGTETKYQHDYAIAKTSDPDFIRRPARLDLIRSVNHGNYPPLGGRHRGLLYNHHIEQLRSGAGHQINGVDAAYLYPHIL
ncbi:MAG: radical SAM protein [Thermoleophilia bacterium]